MAWVRAAESDSHFSQLGCDGTAQCKLDQAGDTWTLGAICASACAAPEWKSQAFKFGCIKEDHTKKKEGNSVSSQQYSGNWSALSIYNLHV